MIKALGSRLLRTEDCACNQLPQCQRISYFYIYINLHTIVSDPLPHAPMAVYMDIAGEIRYRILEYYLAASAAQMRAANSNHVKTLSLPIVAALRYPHEDVLTAAAKIGTVAVRSPYEIAACYASLQPAQAAQIQHIHLSKGFAMPSSTSLSYKSLLRVHKLWSYFPDLELVTLDGVVSVRSTADCARFAVYGRSKLYSMALYAAEAKWHLGFDEKSRLCCLFVSRGVPNLQFTARSQWRDDR